MTLFTTCCIKIVTESETFNCDGLAVDLRGDINATGFFDGEFVGTCNGRLVGVRVVTRVGLREGCLTGTEGTLEIEVGCGDM